VSVDKAPRCGRARRQSGPRRSASDVPYLADTLVGPITVTGRVLVDGLLNTALIVPLCWLVSGLSYDTIEKPFLQLRRKYH
jgi:hypothetical protein